MDTAEADIDAVEAKASTNETNISANAEAIAALEEKVGDGYTVITEADIDAMFA